MSLSWVWFAIPLAFILGAMAHRWLAKKNQNKKDKLVSQEYFKGLNYILNEEPDKAIEVFIKALEVDSETVELHLALGGLFRRKGQVSRATRIHQNLVARPSLPEDQRLQAVYELAQDYYKAGLFDRAESLYLELKDSALFKKNAISGLLKIYQQEKDWSKAIDTVRLLKRVDQRGLTVRTAHYWCELAQIAIDTNELDAARKYLRQALQADKSSSRAILLQGELSYCQQEYKRAIDLWQSLCVSAPRLAELVVDKIVLSYQHLNDHKGLSNYLLSQTAVPREHKAFKIWLKALVSCVGHEKAQSIVYEQFKLSGVTDSGVSYLSVQLEQDRMTEQQLKILADLLLNEIKQNRVGYQCRGCGFDSKSLYWCCPNCGDWDSFV